MFLHLPRAGRLVGDGDSHARRHYLHLWKLGTGQNTPTPVRFLFFQASHKSQLRGEIILFPPRPLRVLP